MTAPLWCIECGAALQTKTGIGYRGPRAAWTCIAFSGEQHGHQSDDGPAARPNSGRRYFDGHHERNSIKGKTTAANSAFTGSNKSSP